MTNFLYIRIVVFAPKLREPLLSIRGESNLWHVGGVVECLVDAARLDGG